MVRRGVLDVVTEPIRVLVAAHKRAPLPSDGLYLPVHVGHALNLVDLGYQPDDEGDNISDRNRSYCELTALYWAWKNRTGDGPVGLAHYRRYFVGTGEGPNGAKVLSTDDAADLMREYDVVIGKPRNYVIETIDSHYRNGHHGADLDVLRAVVQARSPEYVDAFDSVFRGRKLSLYNMMIMRREAFDEYAEWLFDILGEVEVKIDNERRSAYQQRTFGYLGERLLNVWVRANRDRFRVGKRKIVNTEGEPKIQKAIGLVKRKLGSGPAE